jgi:hypothetical protein
MRLLLLGDAGLGKTDPERNMIPADDPETKSIR